MNKRDFIKNISLAALGSPLYLGAMNNWVTEIENVPIKKLAKQDDFWLKVRGDYKLKPDYINLESGYYNIIPTPTLNAMVEHAKMVNYQGSYYMRTVQWENKKRMAQKLAEVVGCTAKNVIITRNTTPRKKRNVSVESNSNSAYTAARYWLVSTTPGFARTAMNGIIDATPIVSSSATMIITIKTSNVSKRSRASRIS